MRSRIALAAGLALGILIATGAPSLSQEGSLWVRSALESLRAEPEGEEIAELFAGAELEPLETRGEWVKVRLEGWIWKEATTADPTGVDTTRAASAADAVIAGGFAYENVAFEETPGRVRVIGEVTNGTGTDYRLAHFSVSVYDADERLLAVGYFNVTHFAAGQRRSFSGWVDVPYEDLATYKIDFVNAY